MIVLLERRGMSLDTALGYPLFIAGALSLVAGLWLTSFWPMALGLAGMAAGALRFTERW